MQSIFLTPQKFIADIFKCSGPVSLSRKERIAKYTVRVFISGAEEQGANDLPESDAATGKNVLGK